ncbi:hypothetical protein PO909_026302 [Leuciscus waleckii]
MTPEPDPAPTAEMEPEPTTDRETAIEPEPAASSVQEEKPEVLADQVCESAITSELVGVLVELEENDWFTDWSSEPATSSCPPPLALLTPLAHPVTPPCNLDPPWDFESLSPAWHRDSLAPPRPSEPTAPPWPLVPGTPPQPPCPLVSPGLLVHRTSPGTHHIPASPQLVGLKFPPWLLPSISSTPSWLPPTMLWALVGRLLIHGFYHNPLLYGHFHRLLHPGPSV